MSKALLAEHYPHTQYVEGWADDLAFFLAQWYASTFLKTSPCNIIEMGVHHGYFFIGLEQLASESARAVAIDIFDLQDKNVSHSGKGDIDIFKNHVQNHCKNPERVEIVQKDTLDIVLSAEDRHAFDIISVDAGHSAAHAFNDLTLAAELVSDRGIVLLDDVLNPGYCGVATGSMQYFLQPHTRIVPVAIGYGKLMCCHRSHKNVVFSAIMNQQTALRTLGIKVSQVTQFAYHDIISLCGGLE